MRLFTALDLTDDARSAIAGVQDRIREVLGKEARSLRFVREEHLHLTLVFIGEVEESRGGRIVEVMQRDLALPEYQLVFGGLGAFPPRGAPRTLWLGTVEGAQETRDVHAAISARLTAVGIAADSRPFSPHLTLGRWREERGSGRVATAIKRELDPGSGAGSQVVACVPVRAVTLYQSRLSSTGPTYTSLARARLQ